MMLIGAHNQHLLSVTFTGIFLNAQHLNLMYLKCLVGPAVGYPFQGIPFNSYIESTSLH